MNQLFVLLVPLLLICPLSMVFMMRGKHGGGHDMHAAIPVDEPTAAYIAELEGKVRALEAAEGSGVEAAEGSRVEPTAPLTPVGR
jgi:hypothetical protein